MNMFNFWRRWLQAMIILIILFSLYLTYSAFDGGLSQFNTLFFENSIPEGVITYQRWVSGLLGSVWMAYGIALLFITDNSFDNRERWAWNCITVSLLVWFLVDSFISFFLGVGINAIGNSIYFVLIILPLLFTRKHFKQ